MNFDEWCYSKQIKGNWKEALYNHIMAKYLEYENSEEVIRKLKQEEWATAWNEVLDKFMGKALAAING